MEFNSQQDQFLHRLQELHFSAHHETGSVAQKSDITRNMMVHLSCAQSSNIVPTECDVSKCCRELYEVMVDSLDSKTGLNNYAEGALAICRRHKNESQKWESVLTLESVLSMDCIKEMMSEGEKYSRQYLPSDNEDDSVFKNERTIRPSVSHVNKSIKNLDVSGVWIQQTSAVKPGDLPRQVESEHCGADIGFHQDGRRKTLFSNSGHRQSLGFKAGHGHGSVEDVSAGNTFFHRNAEGQTSKRPFDEVQSDAADTDDRSRRVGAFKTAKQQLTLEQNKKFGRAQGQVSNSSYGNVKKSLGTRRGPSSKFVPPTSCREEEEDISRFVGCSNAGSKPDNDSEPVDERLKGIDPKMVDLINNEIMDHGPQIAWNDIAGLTFAKKTIKEIVVWPMLRPDIFVGLRGPPKGLLLFGPPGTGKTLIGKCIACQSKSTFYCISASTLTSKWVGEGEKMVRALFAVARCNQPAVLFIDEIDSLLSQRSDGEHEASRRMKTEFLVQLDGASTDSDERILVIGATNRPQEIDEAARRRFMKRLYIPLPDCAARQQIITNLMLTQEHSLSDSQLDDISKKTDGYSGADMANLCREAALGPIRSIPFDEIETITAEQVRCIMFTDFEEALLQVRASVSSKDLNLYIDWNNLYGSFGKGK